MGNDVVMSSREHAVSDPSSSDQIQNAYRAGRAAGLSIAAVAASVIAFVNALGIEKSGLAIVLALFVLRGIRPTDPKMRRRGWVALGFGVAHVVLVIVILVLFRDRFAQLLRLLQGMG